MEKRIWRKQNIDSLLTMKINWLKYNAINQLEKKMIGIIQKMYWVIKNGHWRMSLSNIDKKVVYSTR